jgi:hypothetical protein
MSARSTIFWAFIALLSITCKDNDTVYVPMPASLTDPSLEPLVMYTSPAGSSVGPYDNFSTSITVRFNKLMDYASLHHAIHFTSTLGDLYADTSLLSLNQGDVATITPMRKDLTIPFRWRVGQMYTLKIDSTALDVNGNPLVPSFTMNFTPEPYFRVKTISPPPGAVNVTGNSVQLAFNSPVDSAERSQISISPSVYGLWRFGRFSGVVFDSGTVQFSHPTLFVPGQNYTVSIPATMTDKYGNALVGGFSSSFQTVPFGVINSSPADGSVNWVTAGRIFFVDFSDSLDTASVRQAITIVPPAAGRLNFTVDPRIVAFDASADLLADTIYTVTVDSSVRSKSGVKMMAPYRFSFLTASAGTSASGFRVWYSNPTNGDTTLPPFRTILVYFSEAVDSSSARSGFTISPPVAGLIYFPNPNELNFSPITTFAVATSYTVTIPSTVKSRSGAALGLDYSFYFRTTPFEIYNSYPYDGQTHFSRNEAISFSATDIVDTSTVRGSFSISPSVSGTFDLSAGSISYLFVPSPELEPYTVYTVTISAGLRSQAGAALAAPYTITFATGAE